MTFDNLLCERDVLQGVGETAAPGPAGRAVSVATITINRPKVLNALNRQTLDELRACLLAAQADEAVRAIVLTGAGDKAFVAGADIGELAVQTAVAAREHARAGQQLFDLVETLGKPVIAAINGFALGGGCELAMACTLRLAADTAKLGQPEIALGLLPGYGGTQRLPRLIGKGRALELMLTGAPISATDAERIGLVNRVVPAASLMSEARALAALLARQAPVAVEYILSAVHNGLEMPFDAACALEATLFGLIAATADMREGTTAFLEKRKALFRGN